MARVLITSGPTRQYLDPVRYLTNASSGRMGASLANAALQRGHSVIVVSGPVEVDYPRRAEVVWITSTEELLDAARRAFSACDGLIGAAAPCDYRPVRVSDQKLSKTGEPLVLHLVETPDVVATLAAERKANQWVVGFALETDDHRFRAITKMQTKSCDMMVLNGPAAMNAMENEVEILLPSGATAARSQGPKSAVADDILAAIETHLISRNRGDSSR